MRSKRLYGIVGLFLGSGLIIAAGVGLGRPAPNSSMVFADSSTTSASKTTTSAPTTVTTIPELSPAWVEAERMFGLRRSADSDVAVEAQWTAYLSMNPNEWSTPIGALCWADFELRRNRSILRNREEIDFLVVPSLIRLITSEQVKASILAPGTVETSREAYGPATTRRLLQLFDSSATAGTGNGGDGPRDLASVFSDELPLEVYEKAIALIREGDRRGGDGSEWLDALDAVAGKEWSDAISAGDGLPEAARVYADNLAKNARVQAHSHEPVLDATVSGSYIGGYRDFVDVAKYDQNCQRATIGSPAAPRPDPAIDDEYQLPTTTTLAAPSRSVTVRGAGLNGVLRLGVAGVGIGYSRPGGAGSLTDTTFRHGGVGYQVERLLWWPNGTVRLDVYPDGLHTAVGDDGFLVITPGEADNPIEYVWDTADARYLGGGADFVWDTTFTPEFGTVYRVELRIGVPGLPENVRMSGTSVVWDAPAGGPAVEKYHVWIRPAVPGPGTDSFFNTPTFGTEATWDMRGMARYVGDSFVFQARALQQCGVLTLDRAPDVHDTRSHHDHHRSGHHVDLHIHHIGGHNVDIHVHHVHHCGVEPPVSAMRTEFLVRALRARK